MKTIRKLLLGILIISSFKTLGQNNSDRIHFSETSFLKLQKVDFDPKGKKIEYWDKKVVLAINGKPVFGTDGEIPKFQLATAILTIGDVVYNLDVSDMYNPWFGEKANSSFFKLQRLSPDQYKLIALFSDGAGTYGAEWVIRGKSSIRSILSNDEVILHEYFENKMK